MLKWRGGTISTEGRHCDYYVVCLLSEPEIANHEPKVVLVDDTTVSATLFTMSLRIRFCKFQAAERLKHEFR